MEENNNKSWLDFATNAIDEVSSIFATWFGTKENIETNKNTTAIQLTLAEQRAKTLRTILISGGAFLAVIISVILIKRNK
jgi:dTDP-4-amino-4,6-dideoxygalactose transaminase